MHHNTNHLYKVMLFFRKNLEISISRVPFVFITTALLCGIVITSLYNISISQTLITFFILNTCLCIALYYLQKPYQLVAYFVWFVLFGMLLTIIHNSKYKAIIGKHTVTVQITSALSEKSKTYSAEITMYDSSIHKAIIYIAKDTASQKLMYGDIIECTAIFKPIVQDTTQLFNYQAYTANKHIFSTAYIGGNMWKKIGFTSSIQSISFAIQHNILHILHDSNLQTQNFELLAALIFGNKTYLQADTKQEFMKAGAMHILAVSGLHVGIIAIIIMKVLQILPIYKRTWIKTLLCVICIWIYACITGLSPSVTRAACMFSLLCTSIILNRKVSTYNTLAAAAFIMLILNPLALFDIGFQLSYAAVIGIVYFGNKIQSIFPHIQISTIQYIWSIIAVSIAVQITTLPISLYYFGFLPTYSLLTNICAIPIAFVLLSGVIICICCYSIPYISTYIFSCIDFVAFYLQHIVYVISQLPYSTIQMHISLQKVIILYVLIVFCIVIIEQLQLRRIQKNSAW